MIFEQGTLTDILNNVYVQKPDGERPLFDTLFRQALASGCKVRGPLLKAKGRLRAARHREARGLESYDPEVSLVDQTAPRTKKDEASERAIEGTNQQGPSSTSSEQEKEVALPRLDQEREMSLW